MDGQRTLKEIRKWIMAICKARGLDPKRENILTIKDIVKADKSLSTIDEFINGRD